MLRLDAYWKETVRHPETYLFDTDGRFPNSRLPLLVYRSVLEPASADLASAFEVMFDSNGWPPRWRNDIYTFHHYHSTAHETLGISGGGAVLRFGGPAGRNVAVHAGDVVVIPAGVGHQRVDGNSELQVVGAYPRGQDPDLLHAEPGQRVAAESRLRRVPLPAADPVGGPLLSHWMLHDIARPRATLGA